MRLFICIFLIASMLMACATIATAWNQTGAAQSIENLRAQLRDLQSKEAVLQARTRQLEEDLRPENIEKSLALVGSTRPEELREQRRRQLENERASVQSQLDQLAASRARIETTIVTAEAAVSRLNTSPETISQPPQSDTGIPSATRARNRTRTHPQPKRVRRARIKKHRP